jgi:hypothetical protein
MNNPNIIASIKGLNLWTLTQKIKDHTVQRTSTIQLLQKIDIYKLNIRDRAKLLSIQNGQEQAAFLKEFGVLDRTTGEMRSHSFVLQFMQWLEAQIAGPFHGYSDDVVMRDTSNTLRTMSTTDWNNWGTSHCAPGAIEAASNDDSCGIVVGTGTTAPANSDYKIETKIAQGSAATQLQHGATACSAGNINGANVDMVISRMFINGSGGTITLKEIGLYLKNALQTTWVFLLIHDAVNQTINNGEVALVSYDIRTTV